jgi:hypothetical protein
MRLVGHIARIGEVRNTYRFQVGKPERKRPLEGIGVGEGIIQKCIVNIGN